MPVSRVERAYGMCMEMKSADTLKGYDAHPHHKIWTDAYSKVRVEGTTTFNILAGNNRGVGHPLYGAQAGMTYV